MDVEERVDPDPWVVATLVVTAIGVVGQFAVAAHSIYKDAEYRMFRTTRHRAYLSDSVHTTLRDVEAVLRFLRAADTGTVDVLSRPYAMGETTMLLTKLDLVEYRGLFDRLTSQVGHLNHMTLEVVASDPEFAEAIGGELTKTFRDLRERVNRLPGKPISDVFDECLTVLRELEGILTRLDASN